MSNHIGTLTVARPWAAALASRATLVTARENETCFGVDMAGQNDCASGQGPPCASASKADYQGGAWKMVPAGTCMTLKLPAAADGTARKAGLRRWTATCR